jgi:hypothetical protein
VLDKFTPSRVVHLIRDSLEERVSSMVGDSHRLQ